MPILKMWVWILKERNWFFTFSNEVMYGNIHLICVEFVFFIVWVQTKLLSKIFAYYWGLWQHKITCKIYCRKLRCFFFLSFFLYCSRKSKRVFSNGHVYMDRFEYLQLKPRWLFCLTFIASWRVDDIFWHSLSNHSFTYLHNSAVCSKGTNLLQWWI